MQSLKSACRSIKHRKGSLPLTAHLCTQKKNSSLCKPSTFKSQMRLQLSRYCYTRQALQMESSKTLYSPSYLVVVPALYVRLPSIVWLVLKVRSICVHYFPTAILKNLLKKQKLSRLTGLIWLTLQCVNIVVHSIHTLLPYLIQCSSKIEEMLAGELGCRTTHVHTSNKHSVNRWLWEIVLDRYGCEYFLY